MELEVFLTDQNQQRISQKTLNSGPLKFRASPSFKKDKFKFLYRSPELGGNAIIPMLSQYCAPVNVCIQYSTYRLCWMLPWLHGSQMGADFIGVIGVSSGTFSICQSSYPASLIIF